MFQIQRIIALICILVNTGGASVISEQQEYELEPSALPYFMRIPGQVKEDCYVSCFWIDDYTDAASASYSAATQSASAASAASAAASSSSTDAAAASLAASSSSSAAAASSLAASASSSSASSSASIASASYSSASSSSSVADASYSAASASAAAADASSSAASSSSSSADESYSAASSSSYTASLAAKSSLKSLTRLTAAADLVDDDCSEDPFTVVYLDVPTCPSPLVTATARLAEIRSSDLIIMASSVMLEHSEMRTSAAPYSSFDLE